MNQAAVAYIERRDNRLLCVWNAKYGGWSLPGGKVEAGESVERALARELREETGLVLLHHDPSPIYRGSHYIGAENAKGRDVYIFRVLQVGGIPWEAEVGRGVCWLTREEYLKWTPFEAFYAEVFSKVKPDEISLHLPPVDPNELEIQRAALHSVRTALNGMQVLVTNILDRPLTRPR